LATYQIPSNRLDLARLVNPTERQREFLKAIAEFDFVLFGGEAGGGKSYILRWWLILYLLGVYETLGLRNVPVALFCEDYPSLEDRQVSKIRYEFPESLGTLKRGTTLDFVLRPEYGSGILRLRNLDDPSKYHSSEFAAIAVDELTKNPLSIFNDLRFRLRWPGVERPKFGAGTNPGGPGHSWVKKYWVPGAQSFPAELESIRDQFVMVRSKASDNPHLPEGYWKRLLTLPPDMARKVAYGDWDVYTGQYFPHFDPKRHVITKDEATRRIQKWYTRSLSGDWGYGHPHCIHWHAKDEAGNIITHKELWGVGVGEAEVGRNITLAEAEFHRLTRLDGFAYSWDAGKLSDRSEVGQPKSITQMLSEALGPGIPRPHPCDSKPGVRIIRGRLMSQLLEAGMWQISDACPKLIESLPTMIRVEDKLEEMMKLDHDEATIGDDPVDSAGVGLQWMTRNSVKTRDILLEERLQSVRKGFAGKGEDVLPGADPFATFGGQKFN
jgi:Terminase large subunit, T4likevirus-type, N-terminal